MKKPLLWLPRVLGLLFAGFISLFALDVFGEGYGFWETIIGFLIHMIPTAFVLIALAAAWRRPWIGAVLFGALGLAYLMVARDENWVAYAAISGPLFITGALFLASWFYGGRQRVTGND